ncbi:hypothetical protein HYH02_001710 [Chlamydomonas schloesseri]|uniref:DUF1963 domain-containing protein n=1 Tax=Chlamydomonas schloesseri TaxID=2026947 RepID=A0A836BC58_9CHLO|nr:hypothetical protein HYH02_001710 [Chlamydomonas schloesseri]|eukprot:KAG2453489.1 hypothetical protein HYH02_001710 [Chlamydomonas schloesseri]
MGRPFIDYEEEDATPSGADSEDWLKLARAVLSELGYGSDGDAGLEGLLTHFASIRKPAWKPRDGDVPEGAGLSLLDSKIGGLPFLLPDEDWPSNNGDGLSFLWQFRVQELPGPVRAALGHSTGLMQLFISEALDEDEGRWYLVRVVEESQLRPRDPAQVAAQLPHEHFELYPERAVLGFDRFMDCPCTEDALSDLPPGVGEDQAAVVLDRLASAGLYGTQSGDKLMGWPNWCQGSEWVEAETGQRYLQVVQVEGTLVPFAVGDSGTLVLQRHPTDRAVWGVSWACC